jgi:putative transposase
LKTYQYRLSPTKTQQKCIDKLLEVNRLLYNQCLAKKKEAWEKDKTSLSEFDLIKSEVPQFKGLANYSGLQQTVRRLGKAFQHFWKKNNSYPRFKGKNRFHTLEFARVGDGCKIHDNILYIQHVGKIKLKKHRTHPKEKTLSITKRGENYFVNIACEEFCGSLPKRETSVGIDFGVKTTLTTSDGDKFSSPYFYKDKQKQIAKLSRKKNYKALSKVHFRVANKRKDFNHKLSRYLIDMYDILCVEDFKVEQVKSEVAPDINKKLYNCGINQLKNFLLYKAESAGKLIVLVDPSYTTQTCVCGELNKPTLKQREYKCKSCGYKNDRDVHAANNIKARGLASLELGELCSTSS